MVLLEVKKNSLGRQSNIFPLGVKITQLPLEIKAHNTGSKDSLQVLGGEY